MDIGTTIKFRDICAMFDRVKGAKVTQRKERILRRYYDLFCKQRELFRQQVVPKPTHEEDGSSSFYTILRLLMPSADTARDNYGIQITTLGSLYTRVLQLAADSPDALRLQHRSYSSHRDYADIVYAVLLPRCFNKPSDLTLKQIHDMLDIIAKEDSKSKIRELTRFSELASPVEQKWLIRLLLKSLGLGIGEQRIFGMLHPHAKEVYQRCSDLSRVCNLLADNKLTLDDNMDSSVVGTSSAFNVNSVIEPFHQIRPMLCERFPGKIEELMETDVLFMETKMDGERFQLHYANNRFKYISRNGTDYTHSFGDSYERGTLTPHLRTLLPQGMQSIILDGEMMVWDPAQKRFRDKGENTDVKHLNPERGWQPCFVVYDLLYLNGQNLLEMSYVHRSYKVQKLLTERKGVLEIMKGRKVNSIEEFNSMFQKVLDSNAEGIVLKMQNSTYKPGVRIGGGWYKDKADYIKGLTTEFDLLIIGGFYNRTRTFIESFLLGVLKPSISEERRDEVYSVGRVANVTISRTVLNNTLKPYWHDSQKEPPPMWYHYKSKEAEGRPDVWIEPRQSKILQVKAADLAPYRAFSTQKALHFPRTELVRDDKVWNECMTLEEFIQLCQGSTGIKKINKRQLRLDDFTSERKRQKMTAAERLKLGMAAYEKRYDAEQLCSTTELFKGFSFCILSGAPQRRHTKQQLQALAARNGGTIVENPLPNDPQCICVAGDITYYVERLKQQQPLVFDIVCMDWLLRACEKQDISSLRPKDMIATTEALQRQFAKSYDHLGDSYTDAICSLNELREILKDISDAEINNLDVDELQLGALKQALLRKSATNFFYNCYGYFYNDGNDDFDVCDLAQLHFMQHGGIQLKDLSNLEQKSKLTHIFVNTIANNCDESAFRAWLDKDLEKHVKILNQNWISHSHRARRKLDEQNYLWPS